MKKINMIAETAWHHEGDYSFMLSLTDSILQKSYADTVKMHITLDLDEYMDQSHDLYHELKPKLFSKNKWENLIDKVKCSNKGLMLLYNDTEAIEFGAKFNPDLVEIHSACLNDFYLLDALKNNINHNTKVVFGVGGSTLEEIDSAINKIEHENIILMFGFQNYPTNYGDINFLKMQKIKSKYPHFNFGYADHTAWNEKNNVLITLLGASQGVNYVEKHVSTLYGQERIDWQSAVSIKIFNEIANKVKILSQCIGDGNMGLNKGEKAYSIYGPMKKAAILIEDVKKNQAHSLDKVIFKRTNKKTDLSQIDIINKAGIKYSKNIQAGSVLFNKDFKK